MDERDEQAAGAETPAAAEAEAPPAADRDTPTPPPARPALLAEGWRTPVLWMACGALLAALAGGGAILAHRLSVENDMERVARLLPSASGISSTAPPLSSTSSEPLPPPAASSAPAETPIAAPAAAVAAATDVGGRTRTEARIQATRTEGAKTPMKVSKRAGKATTIAAAKSVNAKESPRSPAARRRSRELQNYYSAIFRRCPQPGEPGAIECRRHICNGAESEGPACKPYRNASR